MVSNTPFRTHASEIQYIGIASNTTLTRTNYPLERAINCTRYLVSFPPWQSTIASHLFYTDWVLGGIPNTLIPWSKSTT
jgi:hypothetical protein